MKKLAIVLCFFAAISLRAQQASVKLDTLYAAANTLVSLPIKVAAWNGVGSFSFFIDYNPQYASFQGFANEHPDLSGGQLLLNDLGNRLAISWVDMDGVSFSEDTLLLLQFSLLSHRSFLRFDAASEITDTIGQVLPAIFQHGHLGEPLSFSPWASDTLPCAGDTIQLFSDVLGGVGDYVYQWTSTPSGFHSDLRAPRVSPQNAVVFHLMVHDLADTLVADIQIHITQEQALGSFTALYPQDGLSGMDVPVQFSWHPVANATHYDLFLWTDSTQMPAEPFRAGLTGIQSGLQEGQLSPLYGETFHWKLRARNKCLADYSETRSISLRYLPDLIVDSIALPPVLYAGQEITISYRVTNQGLGHTGAIPWVDGFWLSADTHLVQDPFAGDSDYRLGWKDNVRSLAPGESYTATAAFQLPSNAFGFYYVIVAADDGKRLDYARFLPPPPGNSPSIKESREDNNHNTDWNQSRFDILMPPRPDLQIVSAAYPKTVFSGDTISLLYQVVNTGNAPAIGNGIETHIHTPCLIQERYWTDQVAISPDSVLELPGAGFFANHHAKGRVLAYPEAKLRLARFGDSLNCDSLWLASWNDFPDYLPPDSIAYLQARIVIPHNLGGTLYLFLSVNKKDKFPELTAENNSFIDTIHVVTSPSADLIVEDITITDSCLSGEFVPVIYTVKNAGVKKTMEKYWKDYVFISRLDTFLLDSCTLLGKVPVSAKGGLSSDSSYSKTLNVKIPREMSGDQYVYVLTDYENMVFEHINEDNNTGRSPGSLHISRSPSPDLLVVSAMLPDSIIRDSTALIVYTVQNQGQGRAEAHWFDALYLAEHTHWTPAHQKLTEKRIDIDLDTNESYTDTFRVAIPSDLAENAYLWFYTDSRNNVFEEAGEANNILRHDVVDTNTVPGQAIPIHSNPYPASLKVVQCSFPDTIRNGELYTAFWKITNTGKLPTPENFHYDYLYLSSDTLLDAGDLRLGFALRNASLMPADTYVSFIQERFPFGVSGDRYILLMADGFERSNDNVPSVQDADHFVRVAVEYVPTPDLVVQSVVLPDTLFTGQSASARVNVINQGEGKAELETWMDRCSFISDPGYPQLSVFDAGSAIQDTVLDPDSVYSFSVDFLVPTYLSGIYYFCVRLDVTDELEESDKTNNIFTGKLLTVLSAPPSDLVIQSLEVPAAASLGEEMPVPFSVKNIGVNQAAGRLDDAFFFSDDTLFQSKSDPLSGILSRDVSISPGDSIQDTAYLRLPPLRPGMYGAIGLTNAARRITETDYENNLLTTQTGLRVSVDTLPLDVVIDTMLGNERVLYYCLLPGGGKDLMITLESDSADSYNEIFVAKGRVPEPADYDYKSENPGLGDQYLLVPTTEDTVYYLFARSINFNKASQGVRILAQCIPFSIQTIRPAVVGNDIVTSSISGAAFMPTTSFVLIDSLGQTVSTGRISDYQNSMQLRVKWNLADVPLGQYTLKAENPDSVVFLNNALRVTSSSGLSLTVNHLIPNVFRSSSYQNIELRFLNTGNIDIPFYRGLITAPASFETEITALEGQLYTRDMLIPDTNYSLAEEAFMLIDDQLRLPLVGKDLSPGMEHRIKLRTGGISSNPIGFYLQSHPYQTSDFISLYLSLIESVRLSVLTNPGIYGLNSFPEVIAEFADSASFHDLAFATMFQSGLLNEYDTVGISWGVMPGMSAYDTYSPHAFTGHDFNPGLGCATSQLADIEFTEGGDYFWEINKYDGQAGNTLGWDLIRASSTCHITATSSDPFIIRLASLAYTNQPAYLGGWYPAVDKSWPIVIADGGIFGFDTSRFLIDAAGFTHYNELYGGSFSLRLQGTDTLLLCFTAYVPGIGESGVPGAPGAPGEAGSPGGQGGPGDGVTLPGKGGTGGPGGYGGPGGNGGPGGHGGKGGTGGFQQSGGPGGTGGRGGDGGPGGIGGPGGLGGPGGDAGMAKQLLPTPTPGPQGGDGPPGSPNTPDPVIPDGQPPDPGPVPPPDGPPNQPAPCVEAPLPLANKICERKMKIVGCGKTLYDCTLGIGWKTLLGAAAGAIAGAGVGAAPGAVGGAIWGAVGCVNGIYGCFWKDQLDLGIINLPSDVIDLIGCFDIVGGMLCIAKYICPHIAMACDPNEIVGPLGFGEARFVSVNDRLPYTIHFENDSLLANAPARRIVIRQTLSPNLNPNSLQINGFGFNNMDFTLPQGPASVNHTLALSDSLGYNVHITSGIDLVKNEFFCIMQTIDPISGLEPEDPFLGLLPVNDSYNSGQGYVSYSIKPRVDAETGDSVLAQAGIVFDDNPVIETPEIFNVIDAVAPISLMNGLPLTSDSLMIPLSFTSWDDPDGSGVGRTSIFVSENSSPFSLIGSYYQDTSLWFQASPCSHYAFYTLASDNVLNVEEDKGQAEAEISVQPAPAILQQPDDQTVAQQGQAVFQILAHNAQFWQWFVSVDEGGSWQSVADNALFNGSTTAMLEVNATDSMDTWLFRCELGNPYCSVLSEMAQLRVEIPPHIVVEAQSRQVCEGDSVGFCIEADGAQPITYQWFYEGSPIEAAQDACLSFYSSVSDSGAYYCLVRNPFDSVFSQQVFLEVYPLPKADAGQDTGFCAGGNIVLSGNEGLSGWYWSNGLNQQHIFVDVPGSYTLRVEDSLGCLSPPDTIVVTAYSLPLVSAGENDSIVEGSDIMLGGTAVGQEPLNYAWIPSAYLSDPASPAPIASPPLTTTYHLVVTDANGCIGTDSIRIVVTPAYIYTLNGQVYYQNDALSLMKDAPLVLRQYGDEPDRNGLSDTQGSFSFSHLSRGLFDLSIDHSYPVGGINAVDALLAARHFAGYSNLIGKPLQAADVNADGVVNSNDALLILQHYAALISDFPAGSWINEDSIRITDTSLSLDYYTLCYGDVNTSHIPGQSMKSAGISLKVNGAVTPAAEKITVPVIVEESIMAGSLSLVLHYPRKEVSSVAFIPTPLLENAVMREEEKGIRLGWFNAEGKSWNAGEVLFYLELSLDPENLREQAVLKPEVGLSSVCSDPQGQILADVVLSVPEINVQAMDFPALLEVFPNPLKDVTEFRYRLPERTNIRICIYDPLGRQVDEIERLDVPSGWHSLKYNASALSRGVYTYKMLFFLDGQEQRLVGKMMVIH